LGRRKALDEGDILALHWMANFLRVIFPHLISFFRHAQFEGEMAWENSRKAPESVGENATENALAFAAET